MVYDERSGREDVKRELEAYGICFEANWTGTFTEDLVVASPGAPPSNKKLREAESRGIEVIGEIEYAFRISRAPIVAITGTNGKSTTTVMTYLCLQAAGENPLLCGNIYGSGYPEMPLTEAAAKALQDDILVAEISSFQLDQSSRFHPTVAGITNIAGDHLDRYEGDFGLYAASKRRIFANLTSDDFAIVPAGDEVIGTPAQAEVLTFGPRGDARVYEDRLEVLGYRIPLRELPFTEPHNYRNACMALLLAYAALLGRARGQAISNASSLILNAEHEGTRLPPILVEGLKQFKGLANRMEEVGSKNGVRIINSSMCTNPSAVVSVCEAISERKHVLIGGSNKGLDFSPVKSYLTKHPQPIYLYGLSAAEIAEMLGYEGAIYPSMPEAFRAASQAVSPGEAIVLAPGCVSWPEFEDFRERGNVFKDIATRWLDL
jgi:UDP-N-acetylmuramoylalanine--D-glutamate ligase